MVNRKHPLARCEECPLYEVGKFVPSEGPAQAAIAFVGETPGVVEARSKRLFVGPSGKLLDIVMAHHEIRREDVFLSNACLCRPPDNATPPRAAISACQLRLKDELLSHGVETAVALGNTACESLLGQAGVTKLRVGPSKPSRLVDGLRIIPTFHPAACLRQGDQFPFLVTDIGKIHHESPVWNPPQFVVAHTENDALSYLDAIDDRLARGTEIVNNPERVLVIDIEVDIEKDSGFDHPNQYGMLCIGIGYDRSKVVVLSEGVMGSPTVRSRLGELLRKYRIVAQNGKFDLAGLYPIVGGLELYFDTMLASYTFDERPGIHGLKWMAVEYLGAPQYDDEIRKYIGRGYISEDANLDDYSGYGRIPRELLYRYNAYDVACTYALYEMFRGRFESSSSGSELRRVHDHLVRASNQLMYVELNGIAVDRPYLKTLDEKFRVSLGIIEEAMNETIKPFDIEYNKRDGVINPRSPMQVKKFFADHEILVDSTNVDTLKAILEQKLLPKNDAEVRTFVRLLLNHRREAKMHGTYVKGIAKRLYRGRVYPTFLLHGTVTGRLSCRNPNLQNIPRDSAIRALFIPAKPDNVFLQTDYSQAELRVLSYLARDNYFRDIFNAGDIDLFDDLTPILYPGANKSAYTAVAWKELRIRVKAYVYGVSYGRSEFSIASEFDISVKDARAGMERFFDVIPEIVSFREQTRQAVRDGNDLVTPWGRHRRYTLITPENESDIMNEALAFLPQSTASDMCLQAMGWVRQDTKGFAWVRNIVHDSILLECHPDDVKEVQEITERRMIESAQTIVGDYVKFAVESKIGKNWGEV